MRSAAPADDEFELSVIGPGRGECLLLHIGLNEWVTIDSCVAAGTSEPVALEYLRQLDRPEASTVKLVVATHWHDDHTRGISSVLSASPHARFACSLALRNDVFATLVGIAGDSLNELSGVEEFGRVLDHLAERRDAGHHASLLTPQWAIEQRTLLELSGAARPFPIRISCLSPSDATVQAALEEISALIPRAGDFVRTIPAPTPNHTSVVLWVEVGSSNLLLGADLEHSAARGQGWWAVIDAHSPRSPASVFKIPHHGSKNGHSDEVWEKMVTQDSIAVITPFSGGRWLPGDADLHRIVSRAPRTFCTARRPSAAPRRDPMVEKKIRAVTKARKVAVGQAGHVRVRWRGVDGPSGAEVALFNGAFQLKAEDLQPGSASR